MTEYFDFEVNLRDVNPPIWRRFLLRRTLSFHALHEAIQDACGWTDSHLSSFHSMDEDAPPIAETIVDEESEAPPANKIRLSSYFTGSAPGRTCRYVYDYGDYWEHDVVLRGTVKLPEAFERRLLDGARSFPPEDCGGTEGYDRMVEFRRTGVDAWDDDPEGLETWLGSWQPDGFDLKAVKQFFDR